MISGEELFRELELHIMRDERPSRYLESIRDIPELKTYPFDMLLRLQSTPQPQQYHPEGSVWNHTLMVVDEAAKVKSKSKSPDALLWAALLHDIGKPSTTRNRKGKITSYGHEQAGAGMAREFLSVFLRDERLIDAVCSLIRYHMQPLFVVKGMPFADLEGMAGQADIQEIALLGLCDRLGRAGSDKRREREHIRLFLEKAKEVKTL